MLAKQPPAVHSAVRERAAEAIGKVERASRVDWLPLSVQLEILAALEAEAGARGYDAFCAAHFSSMVEQPLVKSVFEGTLRVFGVSPGGLFKMFGKSWTMLSSGCGVVLVEGNPSPEGTTIRVQDLPIAEPQIDLFVRGFRATFRGVIDAVEKQGNVELESFDRRAREATYLATWR